MKAVWYETQGAAADVLVCGEMPTPHAGDGEVLVRMHHSGANPSDVKMRNGPREMAFPRIVPHSDGAGVVEAVGSGIDPSLVGTRVFVRNGQWGRAQGTAAEYVALDADLVHPLPAEASFEVGAGLGIPALTAAYAIFKDGAVEGENLLVHGGGGTVARLAVQMAVDSGAKVFATTSGNGDDLRNLGCQQVFDYRDPDVAAQIMGAAAGGMHRVIDAEIGVNLATNIEICAPKATIVGYGTFIEMTPTLPFIPMMFKNITLASILVYLLGAEEAAAYAAIVHDMLADGRLDVPVATVLPLDDCVKAHELVEAGGRGGAVVLAC